MKKIVLKNNRQEVVRVFPYGQFDDVYVLYREDKKRIEVVPSLAFFEDKRIPIVVLKEFNRKLIESNVINIGRFGCLELDSVEHIQILKTDNLVKENQSFNKILGLLLGVYALSILFFLMLGSEVVTVQDEVKEKKRELVKVVSPKKVLARKPKQVKPSFKSRKKIVKNRVSLKRTGALAALGQLGKSTSKSGLDLGAIKKTSGAGLGGDQGSGGVQQSLYSTGIKSSSLGAGHNLQGGGGYGKLGKGGGKAGRARASLIGSSGISLVAVPNEASIPSGVDGSLIGDVVRKNIGQIRFCYEQGLQVDSSLSGRVSVKWWIDDNGSVSSAKIKNTSINSQVVESCILRRLKTWRFPASGPGQRTPVSYPFLLKRVGRS